MSRSSSWPISDTRRLPAMPARAQPRQRFPRVAWVLAVSAFLCGAMVSAAAFAVGWKHEAQKGSSAQAALLAATARNHALSGAVVSARAATLTARTAARRSRADAASAQAATSAAPASRRRARVRAGLHRQRSELRRRRHLLRQLRAVEADERAAHADVVPDDDSVASARPRLRGDADRVHHEVDRPDRRRREQPREHRGRVREGRPRGRRERLGAIRSLTPVCPNSHVHVPGTWTRLDQPLSECDASRVPAHGYAVLAPEIPLHGHVRCLAPSRVLLSRRPEDAGPLREAPLAGH